MLAVLIDPLLGLRFASLDILVLDRDHDRLLAMQEKYIAHLLLFVRRSELGAMIDGILH